MFTLATFLYNEPGMTKARLAEVCYALKMNQINPHIQRVIVLCCPKFTKDGPTSNFLIDNRLEYHILDSLQTFRDVVLYCQNELTNSKIVLAYPDVFFPINSGLGSLNMVNLKKNALALTPYHLTSGDYVDNLYTGVSRSYQNKKIKLHGLDGKSICSWIFSTPLKLDKMSLGLELTNFANSFENPIDSCLTEQFSRNLLVSNPSLEIISIKLYSKWHPKLDCNFYYRTKKVTKSEMEQLLQKDSYKSITVFPSTLSELGKKLNDSSDYLGQYLIEFQTGFYNGEKVIKMPPDQIGKGKNFDLKTELANMRKNAYPKERSSDASQLSSRLLHPEKVASTFMMAQQRGRLMAKK